jgi:CubicO group peptidase (beta-lactamase class C family)
MIKRTIIGRAINIVILPFLFSLSAWIEDGPANAHGQAGPKPADQATQIKRIEEGLGAVRCDETDPALQLRLQQIMEEYNVPGLSLAVIDDFKIAWAKGYGVTAAGGKSPVTLRTMFQAGSVSKPVAAVGALALVEHGKLILDEDVNDRLKG